MTYIAWNVIIVEDPGTAAALWLSEVELHFFVSQFLYKWERQQEDNN